MRDVGIAKENDIRARVASARAAMALNQDWAEDLDSRMVESDQVVHGDLYQPCVLCGGDSSRDHMFDVWLEHFGLPGDADYRRDVHVRRGEVTMKDDTVSNVTSSLVRSFTFEGDTILKGDMVIPNVTGERCLVIHAWALNATSGWPGWNWRFEMRNTPESFVGPDEIVVPVARFKTTRVDGDDPVDFDVAVTQLFHGPICHDEHWSYQTLPVTHGDWAGPTGQRARFNMCDMSAQELLTRSVTVDGRGNLLDGGSGDQQCQFNETAGPTGPEGEPGPHGANCQGSPGDPGPGGATGPLTCWCAESSSFVSDLSTDGCKVTVVVTDTSYEETGNNPPIPWPYDNECAEIQLDCSCLPGDVGAEFTCSCSEKSTNTTHTIEMDVYEIDSLAVSPSVWPFMPDGVRFEILCVTDNVPVMGNGNPCDGYRITRVSDLWPIPVLLPQLSVDVISDFDTAVRTALSGCTGPTGGPTGGS